MNTLHENRLLLGGHDAHALTRVHGTPLYVYEADVIRGQCRLLRESFAEVAPEFHFAVKSNFNPAILGILREEGLNIDAVSPHEVRLCLAVGFTPEQILYTGNNASDADLRYCLERGVAVNLGSLGELERYGTLNPGGRVSLRINPDVGAGHHHHVITGGPHSKFGIYHTEHEAILAGLARHNLRLVGIHSHIGTGILETADMLRAMEIILHTAAPFDDLEFINFGGGLGIPYRPGEQPLPIAELGREMARRFREFCGVYGRPLRMKLEPGRIVVGPAGTLLVQVTNIQSTPAHTFVGTDSGFNHLVRPALYGAYHEIVNASRVEGVQQSVVVAGNLCESGDVFTQNKDGLEDRMLTTPRVGDLLAFRDAGAYGMSQSSQYNLRPRPAEVLLEGGDVRLIRRRETYEDLIRNFPDLD